MNFREAQFSDLDKLVEWTLELHRHEDDGNLESHPDLKKNLTRWLENDINNPASLYLIAEITDITEKKQLNAGFICARQVINDNGFLAQPMKGIIQILWVEPVFRRNQIGQQLVEQAEICFRNIGISYVECTFTSHNHQGEKFWKKMQYDDFSVSARKLL